MECAVCGNGDELLYTCGRCGEPLCATHHGRAYHRCSPDPDGDWNPPGTRDTTSGGRMALASRDGAEPAVQRPEAQLFPDAIDDGEGDVDAAGTDGAGRGRSIEALPPDAARPGYGPDSPRPEPVGPADSLAEWFRRQTYVSLSLKVGFLATLWSAFVFSSLAVGLSVLGA